MLIISYCATMSLAISERITMPPITAPMTAPEGEEAMPLGQDEGAAPQFQLLLRTTDGDHILGASDTVNDLVDQAKIWLNATDAGAAITDAMVRSIILQEVDPATGAYVDGEELPVESKQDVVAQARNLGAR